MKTFLLFFLLVSSTLFSQQAPFFKTSEDQTDYYKYHLNDLKDENGNIVFTDSLPYDLTFTGEEMASHFGCSVSSAGDVNGDGFSDVVVSAPGYNDSKGRAYIFYGGLYMNNTPDVIITGELNSYDFGNSLSAAGDLNHDGYSDVIIGANLYINLKGRAYIFYGGIAMDNIADITIDGENTYNLFGESVSSAGDVNGDGVPDIIIGAIGYNGYTGRSYIYKNFMKTPVLLNPLTNSIDNPTTINFKWRKLRFSLYYNLIISQDSLFNIIVVNDTIYNDTSKIISGFNKDTKYFWKIVAKDSLGNINTSLEWNYTTIDPLKLSMKVLMEGMYSPLYNNLPRKDTAIVYLRNSSSPFALVDSALGTIDSITQNGLFNFMNASSGTYYIISKHFNCIETWSKFGGESIQINVIFNYDFTSAGTQAFGGNLKLKGTKYCMYSGDIDQNGYINLSDVIPIYNDALLFVSGSYIVTDLTGDSIVDLTDLTICYNNSVNFVGVISP